MPENKIIPIQIGGQGYTTPLTDIGSGYAAGITSAGKSIAGAITSVMGGGIDPQTGQVQHGILDQNNSTNEQLGFLKDQGILSQSAFDSIMGKGLSARQQILGSYMGAWQTNMKSQVEQQNKLAQIQASGDQAMRERAAAEAAASQRQAEELKLKQQEMLLKNPQIKIVE